MPSSGGALCTLQALAADEVGGGAGLLIVWGIAPSAQFIHEGTAQRLAGAQVVAAYLDNLLKKSRSFYLAALEADRLPPQGRTDLMNSWGVAVRSTSTTGAVMSFQLLMVGNKTTTKWSGVPLVSSNAPSLASQALANLLYYTKTVAALPAPKTPTTSMTSTVSDSPDLPPIYPNWPKKPSSNWPCPATAGYCAGMGGYNATTAVASGWPWDYYGNGGKNDWASTNSYGPHNCTLYAAFRLAEDGVANSGNLHLLENLGDASEWANSVKKYFLVNQTPAVGAIAQWNSVDGSDGHVAYVDSVDPGGAGITISEDNFMPATSPEFAGGYTARIDITSVSAVWPANFIHFSQPLGNA